MPWRLIGAVSAALLWLPCGALAQQEDHARLDPHAAHRQMMQSQAEPGAGSAGIRIPDTRLVTQAGDEVRLASDVVGDRIVVMDFVYTTCTTVCPVLSAILSQVQGQVADRLGEDVVLVSITVDPQRDTPARLLDYSQKMRAADGWYWLTGAKTDVDDVLRALGVYTPNFEDHPAVVLVGDAASGEWTRLVGFPGAGQIVERINEFSAARRTQAAVTE
ncbi:MAG: SCO family protein [Gammaproteobacteria bacterium]|nr:SCO family protein [Gammaproteobacteria bacterium]MDH4253175.1 SCO family protein [Gammaproteobacteria bacterium]MDH5308463.1 SCO family protein [Gammaproteobacteria bacterium]